MLRGFLTFFPFLLLNAAGSRVWAGINFVIKILTPYFFWVNAKKYLHKWCIKISRIKPQARYLSGPHCIHIQTVAQHIRNCNTKIAIKYKHYFASSSMGSCLDCLLKKKYGKVGKILQAWIESSDIGPDFGDILNFPYSFVTLEERWVQVILNTFHIQSS